MDGFAKELAEVSDCFRDEMAEAGAGCPDFPIAAHAVEAMLDLQAHYGSLMAAPGDPLKGRDDTIEDRLLNLARCALVAVAHRRMVADFWHRRGTVKAKKKRKVGYVRA